MKIAPYLLCCCALATFWSCKNERHQVLPPEEVIRQYQGFIDVDRYEDAKALSTPAERERLDALAEFMAGMPADSTVIHTIFHRINCREMADGAVVCDCVMEDEEGEYDAVFQLVKINGTWRVDVPAEEEPEDGLPAPLGKTETSLQRL